MRRLEIDSILCSNLLDTGKEPIQLGFSTKGCTSVLIVLGGGQREGSEVEVESESGSSRETKMVA